MNYSRMGRSAFLASYSVALCLAVATCAQAAITFEDATATAGFTYEGETWGGSWGDLNGDHLPDLFSNHHRNPEALYVNLGSGRFADRSGDVDVWQALPNADTHGGSWADFDNDGDLDLYIAAGRSNDNQFFRNDAGRLVDATAQWDPGIPNLRGRQPIWFDFTGDGLLDFFLAAESAVPLFARSGAGFVSRTSQAAFSCSKAQIGMLADLVGGPRLEALCISKTFVVNAYDYPAMPFTRVTTSLPKTGLVNDVVTDDFNGDRKTDIFVLKGGTRLSGALQRSPTAAVFQLITQGGAEKRGRFASSGNVTFAVSTTGWNMTPSNIFIGSGGQRPPNPVVNFRSITFTLQPSNVAHQGIAAHNPARNQGIYIGYDPATGTWDVVDSPGGIYTYIYVDATSSAPVSAVSAINLAAEDAPIEPKLYLRGATKFSDATVASGLNEKISCVGAAGGDFDNDADVDLFVVCRGAMQNLSNRLYENQGDGTFILRAQAGGAAGPTGFGSGESESVVVADYDVDGRLDLYVTNGLQMAPVRTAGGPELLFHNVSVTSNHWLELDLEGTASNRDGIGARVLVTANGKTQLREQDGGYHRWSQDSQVLHFGLGSATEASVRVEWPGGAVDTFDNVTADSLYSVIENSGIQALHP